MPSDRYFGSEIALFKVEINGTELVAGAVEDVSIRGEAEHTEFFDPENVTFDEVKRSEAAVNVEFTIKEFDVKIAQYWLDGGSSASTSLTNTNDVAQYDVTLEELDTTGDEKLVASVTGMHMEDVPIIELARGEFAEHDYSGRASGVTVEKTTVA